jgi:preprotein translocase subunit SecB
MNKSNTIEKKMDKNREMEHMAEVASSVELQSVDFLNFLAGKCKEPDGDSMEVNFTIETASSADNEEKRIIVIVDAGLSATCEKEDSPTVEVRATIRLEYNCENVDQFDKEHIEAFGKYNGVYNAWPYWREYVQSAISRMSLPPLTVPSLRMSQISQQ